MENAHPEPQESLLGPAPSAVARASYDLWRAPSASNGYVRARWWPLGSAQPAHGATVGWDMPTPQVAFEPMLLQASYEGVDALVVAVAGEFGLWLRTDAL